MKEKKKSGATKRICKRTLFQRCLGREILWGIGRKTRNPQEKVSVSSNEKKKRTRKDRGKHETGREATCKNEIKITQKKLGGGGRGGV